jgi:hypothetical protein
MAFTPEEIERIHYSLGYLGSGVIASIQLGIPRPLETLFLVDDAITKINVQSEPRVRRILCIMDGIEEKLVDAQDRLAAERIDEITLRPDELDRLEEQWVRWGMQLGSILGAPFYKYSARYFRWANATDAGSIPVRI